MTGLLRTGALLVLSLILAGCKLAVIVVEGGEVQSTSSGTCSAGVVCINQINDTNYAETFTAIPSSGWRFVKWNSGGDFLCAESKNPECVLSNVELAGYEAAESIVASGATFFIMPVFSEILPRPDYDPGRTDYDGGVDSSMMDRVYWSVDGTPPDADSDQWFSSSVNRCASSYSALGDAGYYSSQGVRRWVNDFTQMECVNVCSADGSLVNNVQDNFNCVFVLGGSVVQSCSPVDVPGRWASLTTAVHTPDHVECEEDVIYNNPGNGGGQADGFPVDDVVDSEVYSAATAADSNVDWGNQAYTLYHANFVDYWNDSSL